MRSVHAIQRAMVRMLHDPAWVARIHAGPVPELSEPERALLVAVDRRAWSTDRYRRGRLVTALVEEYPVTAAVLGVRGVDRFLSTEAFAATLARRGSLAVDFGAFAIPRAGDVARLEQAIALARRGWRPTGGLVTRPGVEPVELAGGTLAFYADLRRRLGPDPLQALASGWEPVKPPAPGPEPEPVLVERSDGGEVRVGGATPALVALLRYARTPRDQSALAAHAERLGCDPGEGAELVAGLVAEGLLVAR